MDIRAHVVALNEKRAKAFEALKSELDATAGKERSDEDAQRIARMDADIDALDTEIREYVARATREQESEALRAAQATIFGESKATEKAYNDPNAVLRAFLRGEGGFIDPDTGKRSLEVDIRGAAMERQLLRQGASPDEIRALAWDTGSTGSLVPTTLARALYEYMEASNGIWRAPCTRLTTSTGENMDFPKLGAHAIGTQVIAQGTAIGGTDPTFLKMTLAAFKYGQLTVVASEAITDTAVDLSSFLGRDLGRGLGRVVATDLVVGTGTAEPLGIMAATTGAGTIATGGSLIAPTVEKLIDLQYSVVDAYRSSGSSGWLMHDSSAGTLRKLRDGAGGTIGNFLWEPSLTSGIMNGTPDRLLGFPVYTDSNVASAASNAKIIGFGDFSTYYIRTVGNVVIESDSSRYFDTDQVAVRAKTRVDGDSIDTTGFNILKQSV